MIKKVFKALVVSLILLAGVGAIGEFLILPRYFRHLAAKHCYAAGVVALYLNDVPKTVRDEELQKLVGSGVTLSDYPGFDSYAVPNPGEPLSGLKYSSQIFDSVFLETPPGREVEVAKALVDKHRTLFHSFNLVLHTMGSSGDFSATWCECGAGRRNRGLFLVHFIMHRLLYEIPQGQGFDYRQVPGETEIVKEFFAGSDHCTVE